MEFAGRTAFVQGVQSLSEGEERRVGLVPKTPYRELDQGARGPVRTDKDALEDTRAHQEMHEGGTVGLIGGHGRAEDTEELGWGYVLGFHRGLSRQQVGVPKKGMDRRSEETEPGK
jgi:hypothetical protein